MTMGIEDELRSNGALAIAGQRQMELAGTHGEPTGSLPAPTADNVTEVPDYARRFRQILRNALTSGSADYVIERVDVIRSLIAKCNATM